MITKKTKGKGQREASRYLEVLMGGPLTLGAALSGLREADQQSLAEFSKLLGVSRSHLCDIEQGRRSVSPERAARFAQALDQSQAQFVRLALQDQIRGAGLKLTVEVKAA
jgi:transcriptional regulator with XRE-family HTH domain